MSKVICTNCNKSVEINDVCELCGSGLMLNDRYYLLQNLGKNIGVKYLAKNKNNEKFIIKKLSLENLDNWSDKELFQRNINILKQVNHAQIPKYIEDFEEKGNLYLVREYIEGVTLENELETKRYTEKEIISLILEISKILDYLHNLIPPILYGNLKLSNIVISNGKVYLTDFELSGDLDKITEVSSYYDDLAPEQIENKAVIESDFYFLALMILKLITRKELNYLKDEEGNFKIRENVNISENAINLLEKLLEKDIKKRLNSSEEIYNTYYSSNKTEFSQNNENISINIKENKVKFNNNIILVPVILILIAFGLGYSMMKGGHKVDKFSIKHKISKHFNKKQNDRAYMSAMSYYNNGQYLSAKMNFETSCNHNKNANSCYKVATMYESGMKMVKKSPKKSKEYYKKACDLGLKKACGK